MAYYENKVEHLDGDLILYQRDLKTAVPNVKSHRKPTWYMKLRVGPKKFINRSTKLTIYEEAYAFARKEYNRLTNAVALGHTLDDFTFEQHWDDWYQRNLNNHTWADDRQRWHKNQAARYYKEYFRYGDGTSMRMNDITPLIAHGYWDWRIAYWSTRQTITTVSDPKAPCPLDKVNREFRVSRPNALWVVDFTYVHTWAGFVYVAFVIDAYAVAQPCLVTLEAADSVPARLPLRPLR